MASIKDVAKRANVGVGTVSRMLNNSGYVSEETNIRIKKAMEELDYTPNELARNLYHKRTGIIAVIVPTIINPFFSEFVENIEEKLYNKGYKTMICNTVKEKNAEKEYLDMLKRHIVDGVISGVHSLDIEEYSNIKKPIVALDRYLGEHIPVVMVDHKNGGRIAAEEFIKNNCKNVLQFKGAMSVASPYHDRHSEFERIMTDNTVKVTSYELVRNRFDTEYFKSVVTDVFKRGANYDGVFGVDLVVIEYMNEAIRQKIKIPQDLKLVSYDGTYVTRLTEPSLTSIVQPIEELAEKSVELLDALIKGEKHQGDMVVLDVQLQKGDTTKKTT